jgi:dTDP-4-dehydrorhamnose reductase
VDLLVVGGSGYLGREVARQARLAGQRVVVTRHRADGAGHRLDVRDRAEVVTLVGAVRPAVVVNAAYRQSDWAITADGAANVAVAAAAAGARLVHVSSDAVFSGTTGRYDETRTPDPVTPYGAAKAAAETAVKAIDPGAVIARTSLIVGNGGSQHERHVHALAAGTATGVLFTDVVRCPVHVGDLAAALLELAASPYSGIHHVAGPDALTRHELGVLIARRDHLDPAALPAGPRTGTTIPLDIRLDSSHTRSLLGTLLRSPHDFLIGP